MSPDAHAHAYDPRRIVRNLRAAVVGEGVFRGASFLAAIVVARTVTTDDFGRFSIAVAIVSVGLLVSDVGLQLAVTRAIAADRTRAAAYVTSALVLGSACSLVTYAAIWAAAALGLLPEGVAGPTLTFGLVLFLAAATNAWGSHLRGVERQDLVYLALSLSSLALLAGVLLATRGDPSVTALLAIWVLAYALRLVLVVAFLARAVERPRWRFERKVVRHVAVVAPGAALAYLLQGAYSHIDVVLLGFLVPVARVGEYAAAYRLVDGVTFLTAGAATAAIFPVFSRLAREQPEAVGRLHGIVTRLLVGVLAPAALLLVAAAGPLVNIVFGDDSSAIARLFALLAPSTLLIALNFVAVFVAFALGYMRLAIVCTAAAAAANVVANLAAVPFFGTTAAAVATFLAELLMLALLQRSLSRTLADTGAVRPVVAAGLLASVAVVLLLAAPDARVVIGLAGAALALPLLRGMCAFDEGDAARLRRAVAHAVSRR